MSWVYVIGHDIGPQKIGFTDSLDYRLKCIQRQEGSRKLAVFKAYEVPCNEALKAERMAHWLLRDKMVRSEWFDVTPEEAALAVERAVARDYTAADAVPPVLPRGRVLWPEHAMGRFARGTFARIEALLGAKDRAAFIRDAVEEKLARDERQRPKP